MRSTSWSSCSSPETVLRAAIAVVLLALIGAGAAQAGLGVDLWERVPLLPCPFHWATGVQCPGCGMTRALLLLAQLRPLEAFAMHPAAPFLGVAMLWRLLRPRAWRVAGSEVLSAAALLAVVAVWVVRV